MQLPPAATPETPIDQPPQPPAPPATPALPAYASFWRRVGGSLLDIGLLWAIVTPLLAWVYGSEYTDLVDKNGVAGPADFLITYVFPTVAILAFWVYRQATPGKMLLNMKIVSLRTGGAPTWDQAAVRFGASVLSALPLGLGYLWVMFDPRRQTWHDKIAGTVVFVEGKADAR